MFKERETVNRLSVYLFVSLSGTGDAQNNISRDTHLFVQVMNYLNAEICCICTGDKLS